MNEIIKNIITRRSIRKFTNEQIKDQDLRDILTAAQYAPSGSNSQSWHFIVIQKKDLLTELNELIRKSFSSLEVDGNTYVSLKGGKQAAKNESYSFYYNAPALIIVTNKKSYPNAMADSACALENMMLAAHSLGLGSCWINQLTWFGENPEIREVLLRLGMPDDETVYGSLAIGYPAMEIPEAPARKGDPFIFIR